MSNLLRITQRFSTQVNIANTTIKTAQCIYNASIQGIDFGIHLDSGVLDYNASTDVAYLVSGNFSKELTRVGDFYNLAIESSDFELIASSPNSTTVKQCHIAFERTVGGVVTTLTSDSFSLSISRRYTWTPSVISNCSLMIDPFSLGTDAETVSDLSGQGNDLAYDTVAPTIDTFRNGIACINFAGVTNENLKSTYALYDTPVSIVGVLELQASDGTERNVLKLGGTTGITISFDDSEFMCKLGAGTAMMATPSVQQRFVFVATYNQTTITMQINEETPDTAALVTDMTPGILSINNGATKGNFLLGDLLVYNKILSAGEISQLVKALASKHNVVL